MQLHKNHKIIFFICWISYASIYLLRLNLSIAAADLNASNIFSGKEIGLMGSMFFFCYAVGQLINGYAGDKINPKLMILFGMAISAISNLIIGFLLLSNYTGFLIFLLWALNGFSQSMLWGPIVRTVSNLYEEKTRIKAAGILSISYAAGSVLAYIVATYIIKISGVWAAFIAPALFVIIIIIFGAIFLPEITTMQKKSMNGYPFKLIKNKNIISNFIPAVALGIIKDNIFFWIPLFFLTLYQGMGLDQSLLYILTAPLMYLAGKLIFPYIFTLCRKNEYVITTTCFAFCIVLLFPMLLLKMSPVITATILGLVTASVSMINSALLSVFPMRFKENNNVSFVSGFMDFFAYSGAAVSSFVLGNYINNSNGFSIIISVWIACAAIAVIYLLTTNKNKFNIIN